MSLHVALSPDNVDCKAMQAVVCHDNVAVLLCHSVQADL